MNECRLCGESLMGAERIRIAPAPSGAQHFARTVDEARRRSISLEIAECPSCGLVQSASAAVEGYRHAITAAGISAPMREHRTSQAQRLAAAIGKTGSRIALVGCGNGYELALLAEAGFDPEGIEFGGAPPTYNGTWPVHDGYPDPGTRLPEAPYDAFACYNFLEHAEAPREFLRAIRESLAPRGCGVVEVPNYERQRCAGRAADYIADHLSYFVPTTLMSLLTFSGFDVLSLNEVREGENIEAIVRSGGNTEGRFERGGSSLERDGALLMAARDALRDFFRSWKSNGAPAVAWGASHQALTLFAGLSSDDQPRVIIDGAPFKQGMFAPASGIPVVAPSTDVIAGAGAVLVIASGYEREIATTLRAKLGFAGQVWCVSGTELNPLD